MTPEQEAAFTLGAGYSPAQVGLLISLITGAVLFLFLGWVLFSAYQGWSDRSLAFKKLGFTILRIALLAFVVLVVIAI
ncbi:integrating conjugative element protein [Pseudomonas sp. PA15(2017)]|uniref:TIGR03758 family integrating conjugative element protein n=1 Tax=Pseudomonas sp. PA15(2017) TaxID=1932111 RepID=UPI000968A23B|nr:TIGR03758 family integrating conjugative element protein [Pseudomonas sp. PA15(2017)]OLU25505.1 integrating conjugative element protein [Pseudomonas sp. PA15(2017)]